MWGFLNNTWHLGGKWGERKKTECLETHLRIRGIMFYSPGTHRKDNLACSTMHGSYSVAFPQGTCMAEKVALSSPNYFVMSLLLCIYFVSELSSNCLITACSRNIFVFIWFWFWFFFWGGGQSMTQDIHTCICLFSIFLNIKITLFMINYKWLHYKWLHYQWYEMTTLTYM